ncbi:hypothetical protein JCM19301_3640 [Jejuia pallidilutea]|uniref:Uncharacterized protein n=1 Tax=Jejuia pallidilutea TaxID=504487 RepID=A0A090VK96_9FLAO|nr:hypothetical protein JCM19301_3640 [Jejuia pallidilutea]
MFVNKLYKSIFDFLKIRLTSETITILLKIVVLIKWINII